MSAAVSHLAVAMTELREILAEPMVMPSEWMLAIIDLDRRVSGVVAHELQGEPLAPAAVAELVARASMIVAELRRHGPRR